MVYDQNFRGGAGVVFGKIPKLLPATTLQASFTVTPSSSTTLPPQKKSFDHTHEDLPGLCC